MVRSRATRLVGAARNVEEASMPARPTTAASIAARSEAHDLSASSSKTRAMEEESAANVIAARAGDRSAFAFLYGRYHRMVHAVVLSTIRTMQRHEAEDLVQDVFAKALRELTTLDDASRFGGWLATIARRSALDSARAGARARRQVAKDGDDEEDTLEKMGQPPPPTSEALEALRAIRSLPEAYRETMMMRLVEGLTGPEIAELTGMKPESVRVNLCRGMKLLREALGAVSSSTGVAKDADREEASS